MHQFKDTDKKKSYSFHESNSNGLCDHCNYYQQLKIEKLANFKITKLNSINHSIANSTPTKYRHLWLLNLVIF